MFVLSSDVLDVAHVSRRGDPISCNTLNDN
jgi:hypothetical protein